MLCYQPHNKLAKFFRVAEASHDFRSDDCAFGFVSVVAGLTFFVKLTHVGQAFGNIV